MERYFKFFMYLFFDTETTGLPKDWNAPISKLKNWPRLVQIAWQQYDSVGNLLSTQNYIIKPNGFTISPEVVKIHGISHQKAVLEGAELEKVMKEFAKILSSSKFLIAHNLEYDKKIVGAEFLRTNIKSKLSSIEPICTMKSTTNFCRLPGYYGYKWPSLTELHSKLFKAKFKEAHDALVDVTACAKCFFELKKKGIIKP